MNVLCVHRLGTFPMVTSLGVVLCKLQAKYELASYDQSACTTIILMSTVCILYNYMQYHTSYMQQCLRMCSAL